MKKPAKKYPGPVKLAAAMPPVKLPSESAVEAEAPGLAEGSSAEERYDQRQAARKSRPRTI
jgi:hypothetical protein